MAEAIRMPLLSDTMKEGIIAAWHKKVGDKVKSDDVLAEVETDKATMEVLPYVDGTLLYVGVEKGKAAQVNDIIAIIGKEGEDFSALLAQKNQAIGTTNSEAASIPPASTTPASAIHASAPVVLPNDATVVRMPLLSDTMKEGKIVVWNKKVGDTVKSDDVLADVETDKATMEVMGYAEGSLLYIGVPAGEAAKVNDIIAIIGKPGTDVAAFVAAEKNAGNQSASALPATPVPSSSSTTAAISEPSTDEHGRIKASPLAKKLAREKGISLNNLKGSGDNGRIIRRDVDSFQPAAISAAQASSAPIQNGAAFTDIPLSQMRKVIAQRLSESKFNAPHFYLRMTVTMDTAITARKAINEVAGAKVSFNDLIIKASAMALRQHPEVNASWTGETIRQHHSIHIGTAVAIDEGLIVPVIKFADSKTLTQIAIEAGSLIEKARNKKLQPPEFSGNTFTISNLGMMDIDEFTAIINPPDACILAVGKIAATPVVENGQIVVRQLMKLTLSCDHRVVDGAVGARFLQTLKAYLENPVTMLA
ncbi:MAG: 2-oxo acid dehydrogenase subunit E2 [Bacteroidetes bacterium]|nr:2-oxo acid dehydrogenase subunit E2 [Bacteroidota bacterium]MBS1630261.1 2-oxo acid dehydrogenase subunit E2 [Bacteroidota bacterium]